MQAPTLLIHAARGAEWFGRVKFRRSRRWVAQELRRQADQRNIAARSWCADVRRFSRLINADEVLGTHSPYSNRALLAFLNSSLIFYHLQHRGKRKGKVIEYYKSSLEKIPLQKRLLEDPKCAGSFERIVNKILSAKQRRAEVDVSSLEREIDKLVYALYDLTPAEIQIVESASK